MEDGKKEDQKTKIKTKIKTKKAELWSPRRPYFRSLRSSPFFRSPQCANARLLHSVQKRSFCQRERSSHTLH